MTDRRRALDQLIDELSRKFSGELALYVKCLTTKEVVERNADAIFPTASCIKVFIMMEMMRRVDAGELALQQTIPVLAEQQVGGSGVLKDLSSGIELTLRDVATLMVVLSDNTATNMLIDLLGLPEINRMMQGIGLQKTRLINRVDFEAIDGDVTRFAVATAREFAGALEKVANGTFASRSACDVMIDIMARQQYLDLLPRYLPYNPFARELKIKQDLRVANKTGFFPGVRCDTALLMFPQRTIVAVALTRGSQDLGFGAENEGAVFLGHIGRAIHDYFSRV